MPKPQSCFTTPAWVETCASVSFDVLFWEPESATATSVVSLHSSDFGVNDGRIGQAIFSREIRS